MTQGVGDRLTRDYNLKQIYLRLHNEAIKGIPIIIKDSDKGKVRKVMDMLRRYLPKSFFKIIKIVSKNNQRSLIAISFKSEIVDGLIKEQVSFNDYLKDPYTDTKGQT